MLPVHLISALGLLASSALATTYTDPFTDQESHDLTKRVELPEYYLIPAHFYGVDGPNTTLELGSEILHQHILNPTLSSTEGLVKGALIHPNGTWVLDRGLLPGTHLCFRLPTGSERPYACMSQNGLPDLMYTKFANVTAEARMAEERRKIRRLTVALGVVSALLGVVILGALAAAVLVKVTLVKWRKTGEQAEIPLGSTAARVS